MIGIFRKVLAAIRNKDTGEDLSNNQLRLIAEHKKYLKRKNSAGRKLAKKEFLGTLGLRGRTLTGASLMAQQNKLGDGWLSSKSYRARGFG